MTVYNTDFNDGVLTRMTYMFGLVVFGNLIDNISKPKFVLIICQVILGICWILTGFILHWSLENLRRD